MRFHDNSNLFLFVLFAALVVFVCAPVWWVGSFVNQDGTPHLYNAYLMGELLTGSAEIETFAALNTSAIPNITGHWLLAAMLPVFGTVATTKIAVTVLYALFVASLIWLRWQTAGRGGIALCMLLAAAIGLNWPWLLGFYNFILAMTALAFTIGLWWRWRDDITVLRAACLFALLVFTFFSHLVSFGILVFCLAILTFVEFRRIGKKNASITIALLILTSPLVFNFLLLGLSERDFQPHWNNLVGGIGLSSFTAQLSAADPFALMTRRSVPFVEYRSALLSIFAPMVWIGLAVMLLSWATFRFRTKRDRARRLGWIFPTSILFVIAIFGPDDFGSDHGGFLRERVLLISLICSIPFLKLNAIGHYAKIAAAALGFVIVFQTAVIWEYAPKAELIAGHFAAAKEQIQGDRNLGSVVFVDGDWRFRPSPTASLSPMLGIGKNGAVWDNYEFGFYLFPVVTRNPDHRAFVSAFREAGTFDLGSQTEDLPKKLERLDAVLAANHDLINILLVWNEQPPLVEIRAKWFETEPYFVSGKLKLFRHR